MDDGGIMAGRRHHRWLGAVTLVAVATVGLPASGSPAPAATNGEVLFVRSTTDRASLYGVQADGGGRYEIRQYGDGGAIAILRPVDLSPEGRRLLWSRGATVDGRGRALLAVSNADGSQLDDIADVSSASSFGSAVWSPDGLEVAYLAAGRLGVIAADGTGQARFNGSPLPPGQLSDLQWSPEGDRLAMVATSATAETIWSTDLDGGDHRKIHEWVSGDESWVDPRFLRWSPQGDVLAYVGLSYEREAADFCLVAEVSTVELASGTVRTLASRGAVEELCRPHGLEWSPDGQHLVLSASPKASDSSQISLYRLDVSDGALTRITDRADTRDWVVSWRPVPDLLARACPTDRVPSAGFADAAGAAHARGIDCAAWWELAQGRTNGSFEPGEPVTRAQMASFVARSLEAVGVELPDVSGSRFSDVDPVSAHAERIEQLAELGLVDGVTSERFAPSQAVSRAQMAKFLVSAYQHAADRQLPTKPNAFVDDDGIALEAYVNAASSIGLTSGVTADTYGPSQDVNRGQMTTFLSRLVDRLARDLDLSTPS